MPSSDYGLTNTLGSFALSNNPDILSPSTSNTTLGGILFGLGKKSNRDKAREQIAAAAPQTLDLKDNDLLSVVTGAMQKQKMSPNSTPHLEGVKDFDVDTSSLGHFGEVNSNHESPKESFWNTKGGNIASSLLGIVSMGLLGAGIGAISGGRRGAASGASYGLGLGALQDIGLRKQGAEADKNLSNILLEQQKLSAQNIDPKIRLARQYMDLNPETAGRPLTQSDFDKAMKATQPYALDNLALRSEGINLGKEKEQNRQAQELTKATAGSNKILEIRDEMRNLLGYDPNEIEMGKNGKMYVGGEPLPDAPGRSIYGLGRVNNLPFEGPEGKVLDASIGKLLQFQIYDQSGKAISIPELETFKKNYLQNRWASEEEMLYGMAQALKATEAAARQAESGFPNKVLETVKSRGGNIVSKERLNQVQPQAGSVNTNSRFDNLIQQLKRIDSSK